MDSILKSWKTLEWDSLQTRLEEEIRAITIRQDGGDEVKKVLLDESNSYRASTTKETRKVAVPLIKAFQKEVDRLTTSGKATEASLIDICSRLMEIPDPSAILEQVPVWKTQAEKANNAIEEANQLRTSIAELHDEFSDLKNQDVTIRQLRERIKQLEGEKTIEVEQSVDETERKLRDEFAAREFEMNMRAEKQTAEKITMEKKVSELEVRLRDAQRRMDSARLAADQRESLESEQIDILSRDLEDANRRVSSLEMEVSRLTADLAESQASSKRGGLEDIAAFGGLMKEKDEQMARIQNENKRLSEALEAEARKAKADHADLVRKLEAQTKIIRDMEVKMAEQQDYEAVKNELRLLREIEFGEAATANEESISRLGETVQSLDRLLAEKNRRLQNENAQLRMNGDRQKETIFGQGKELAELKKRVEEQTELIVRLEKDLSTVGVVGRTAEGDDDMTTLQALSSMASAGVERAEGTVDESSVVGIVTAQRNRFRQKAMQLEEELVVEKTRQSILNSEVEKLKEDNVKLYGKIKFLQSYGGKGSGGVAVPMDTTGNYSEQYENRLDPFRKFNQNEQLRSYTKLKIHDRASLSIGRAIMSSASARMLFFFYLLMMHLLVFLVLYRYAYTESCEHTFQQDCVEKFEQHMSQHHPGRNGDGGGLPGGPPPH